MNKLFAATAMLAMAMTANVAKAEGDAAEGEKVFKKCKACHMITEDMKKKAGPNLYGVIGREAAGVEGFNYSDAMKEAGLTWDEKTLDSFLADPKGFVPKTRMAFKGLKDEEDRANVIAYIKAESEK